MLESRCHRSAKPSMNVETPYLYALEDPSETTHFNILTTVNFKILKSIQQALKMHQSSLFLPDG